MPIDQTAGLAALTTALLNRVRGGPLFDLKWEPDEDPREESVFRQL
ncbi:hypothetical protein OG205_18600 [Lentzea sp. NBC_00516]|nr:hypothetical protein [Lentzea sp. NBC_00516]WUD28932.1 hypothetical protein OG205_18600 [Lentzea sp. NBC_00516]